MDRELVKCVFVVVVMLGIIMAVGIYTYNFYQDCTGVVVRGAFGWVCIKEG